MGKITVHLYGTLANRAGIDTSSCEVDAEGRATLREVFELVAHRYGRQFLDTVVDPTTGELYPHLHAVVNSQSVQRLRGLDTEVDSRDHILVHIFGAMRGGASPMPRSRLRFSLRFGVGTRVPGRVVGGVAVADTSLPKSLCVERPLGFFAG